MSKTAVVTGASRGIGRSIALRLAKDGFDIALNYLFDEEEPEKAIAEIEALGVKATSYQADVSKFEEVKRMMDAVHEEFGSIDVLVNNAGITKDGLLMRMTEKDFDQVIDVNLKSVFNCCRHAVPFMVKQRRGRVVSMASVVGQAGQAGQTNYAASKGGIIAFSKALALEIGSRGITVNCIAPGYVDTQMTQVLPEKARDAIMARIALKRGADTEDIANVAAFLAGDQAAYITGQVIAVNGGMYM